MARRYILSIDGGGIRGVIPACVLARLEEVTGKATRDIFSYVAGTSTGAIIAAGIAAGVPAATIRDLYIKRGREILPYRPFKLLRQVLFSSCYSTKTLHRVIGEELGPAKTWSLNDSPVDILLTAKRLPDGKPWYFVKDNPKNARCTGRLNIVDCATASAAVPTYFPPFTMPEPATPASGCEPVGTLVDGGVGVTGNPVYQACIEAFEYSPGYSQAETTVVSIGTGRYTPVRKPRGILTWLDWLLHEFLESPNEQQTEAVFRQYPQANIHRIDIAFATDLGFDDVRILPELDEYGQKLADEVDWPGILSGRDDRFRVRDGKTTHAKYSVK